MLIPQKKQSIGTKSLPPSKFMGTCFSCGKAGHPQHSCPLTSPPSEAAGRSIVTNSATSVTESLLQ